MFIRLNRKAQGTLEYGIIIAVVVAALVLMQTYIKRGVQGKLRQSADDIGEQFSPGYTTGTTTTVSSVNSTENTTGGAQPITKSTSSQTQTRSVNEQVAGQDQEDWLK